MHKKLKTAGELKDLVSRFRKEGKTVSFANGCFDIIHVGHIRYLKGAKREGDILIVGINSDDSVKKIKGSDRPVMPEDERAEILAAFECVDYLHIFDEPTVKGLLEKIEPDVHCKGTDYTRDTVPERDTAQKLGIRIAITGDPKNHSSSEYIEDIK